MTHDPEHARTSDDYPTPQDRGASDGDLWTRWMRRGPRQAQFLLDIVVLVGAFVIAYLLRFEFDIPSEVAAHLLIQLPYVVLIQFVLAHLTGIYNFIWRYIGLAEIHAFARAALYSVVPILILRLGLPDRFASWRVPLSVIVLDTLLGFGGLLAIRVLRRMAYERKRRAKKGKTHAADSRKPVLLVGAGEAGRLAAREIHGRGEAELEVVGFVDDDANKLGMVVQGVKVLGTSEDIPRLVKEHDVDHVVITIVEASRQAIRRVVEICDRVGVKVRIIPGLFEILQGRVSISRIRDVQIEDLLGREPVHLDTRLLEAFLAGRTVMVTGAGGSIGSELVRQAAQHGPQALLLVERAENALFEIERELRATWPNVRFVPLIADVCDHARMSKIFRRFEPSVVLHAAAHKHVPLMETNVSEAIKNNALATDGLGTLAAEFGADAFVLISTDKAVRPTSVMGASKRLAELAIQRLDDRYESTRFLAVRFGNVLGSAGSVIPIFRQQIANGGPLTVTHREMTRYFMTIPEAAELVLEAGSIGHGGEILILDMGEPVKIVELAEDMITLSGLKPYEDLDIVFTGLRPGEKLYEELELSGEQIAKTRHPKIFVGRLAPYPTERIESALDAFRDLAERGNSQAIRDRLSDLLPEARLQDRSLSDTSI